jgi:integrase
VDLAGGARQEPHPSHVPLSDAALTVLAARRAAAPPKCRYVFSANGRTAIVGVSKWKRRVDAEMRRELGELTPWRVHDLRRTAASGMAALAVQPHVIEAVLNHRSGTIKGVAAVYNRYAYAPEKWEALDAWAAELARITADVEPLALAA